MRMLTEPLGLQGPIAGFNGGFLFKPDLSVIESHILDSATATRALGLILDHGLDAWSYTVDEWLIRDRHAPHVARETSNVRFEATLVAGFTPSHLAHAVKIVGISDDFALVAACEKAVQIALGERASAERSQPHDLDVTHPQANKGRVATTLSRLLGVPREQIATMGDMPNDVPMFRNSGLSIAMGNASDAVTDGVADEGFAKAVRRFVLRPAVA